MIKIRGRAAKWRIVVGGNHDLPDVQRLLGIRCVVTTAGEWPRTTWWYYVATTLSEGPVGKADTWQEARREAETMLKSLLAKIVIS